MNITCSVVADQQQSEECSVVYGNDVAGFLVLHQKMNSLHICPTLTIFMDV